MVRGHRSAYAQSSCADSTSNSSDRRWRLLIALGRVAEAQGEVHLARSRHYEALRFASGTRNNLAMALAAEGLAGVAVLEGDGAQAALLLGLGVTFRGTAIAGDPDVARVAASARDLAGADSYDRAYARGTGMTREEAAAMLAVPAPTV